MRTKYRANIGKKLFILATPVIIGACAMPLVQLADTAIITHALSGLQSITLFGKPAIITTELVNSLFSLLAGYVNPIINMPAVISMALAMSLVPTISSSLIRGDTAGVAHKAGMGLKLALLVGLPCAVGLFLLPTPLSTCCMAGCRGRSWRRREICWPSWR